MQRADWDGWQRRTIEQVKRIGKAEDIADRRAELRKLAELVEDAREQVIEVELGA